MDPRRKDTGAAGRGRLSSEQRGGAAPAEDAPNAPGAGVPPSATALLRGQATAPGGAGVLTPRIHRYSPSSTTS
jgi:hypothetical protein